MSKISLDRITSAFGFKDAFNAVLEKIEDEFSDKVLYRDNPPGTANAMTTDLDLGGNDVNNVGAINAEEFVVNGVDVNQAIEDVEAQIAAIPAETQGYRDEAIAARDAAEASEVAAGLSEDAAAASETNAAGSASTATTQAGLAAGYADEAENWANADEDVQVETGKYSAKHFSAKAEGFADDAAATKLLIDAQAAQVALDASESADNAAAAAAAVSTVTDAADAAAISAANAYGSEVAAQDSLALCNAQVLVATDKATIASDAEAVATLKAQEALVSEGIATAKAQEAMLSASAASDSEDAAAASELAAAGSEALAASSASTAVAAKDVAVSSAQAASSDAGTASSARTDAINAKDAAEAAQAECEAIEEGLQTASTHSHSNKPFLDELNEKTIAGYNVIRSQNLPNVGDYQQGTFCIVDAYEPKKVYLNIGLWWIEIPQSDSLYGKVTRFDDVKLLYRVEDGGQRSAVGPDPKWSYADRMYAEDGRYVGLNEPTDLDGDGQLWWSGPGYTNLLQWSEKFDESVWLVNGSTESYTGDVLSGFSSAVQVVGTSDVILGLYQTYSDAEAGTYTLSGYVKPITKDTIGLRFGGPINKNALFDVNDKLEVSVSNVTSGATAGVSCEEDGWYRVWLTYTTSSTVSITGLFGTVDTYARFAVTGAQLTKTDRPVPYVKTTNTLTTVNELTDYVPAIHGDKGVWCGPSYGNLIGAGYENLNLWSVNGSIDKSISGYYEGNPITKFTSTIVGASSIYSINGFGGTSATFSLKLKSENTTRTELLIRNGSTSTNLLNVRLNWDTMTGEIRSGSGTFDIVDLGDGWFEFSASVSSGITSGNQMVFYLYPVSSSGIIGETLLACAPQVTATSVPMPYVLPGTTVASAAGTSGDNGIYFDMAEEPDGVELVYNGGFDTSVDGWVAYNNGTLTHDTDKLAIDNTNQGYGGAYQTISTIPGVKYKISGLFLKDPTNGTVNVGTSIGGSNLATETMTASKVFSLEFVATTATTYVTLITWSGTVGAAQVSKWDNISVQRLSSPLMQCFERSETDGVELVTNGTFDTDSGWVKGTGWSIADGKATHTSPDYGELYQDIALEAGKTYIATFNFTYSSGGGMGFGEVGQAAVFTATASGFYSIKFVSTGAAGIRLTGGSVNGSVDNISIQKLKPATCTVAAEVTMGVSNVDTTAARPVLSWRDSLYDLWYEHNNRIVRTTDGTTGMSPTGIEWSRNERHIKLVQTNADGKQFRVGNKRIGIDEAIQWGSWASFDGSFNPLTALRLAYGNIVPIWLRRVMVSNNGGLSDAEILTRMEA